MTRGSRRLVIGCGALVALGLFAGCAQQQQRSRSRSPAAALVEDTATTAVNAVSAATGAAADVVNGAATATGTSKPKRPLPAGAFYWSEVGMKRNGRGGYTASPAQKARHKAVQRQAMAYRKYVEGRRAKQAAAATARRPG